MGTVPFCIWYSIMAIAAWEKTISDFETEIDKLSEKWGFYMIHICTIDIRATIVQTRQNIMQNKVITTI